MSSSNFKKVQTRIQNKHDLEVNWDRASFVPMAGELIIYDIEVDAEGNTKTIVVDDESVLALPRNPDGTYKRTTPYTYERFKIGDGIRAINDLPFASVNAGNNINIATDGTISVPSATGNKAGVTIVYPEASCTSFTSDSGTVTPAAVQKGAKMFAITRPPKKGSGDGDTSVTVNAIPRWEDTTGDLKNSKITIEDVTNTKDTSKKANVLVIPAGGNKKMVYGYCTDQVDGTSFIGGLFDNNATEYPYNAGLAIAIGGTTGNLLWKGKKVTTVDHTHSVTTADAAPHEHTHNVTVSGTTGGNGGTAVNAVTGYDSFSGGSGNLTSDSSTDGIKYVEDVTHTAASLTGTKTFNTDAIKSISLSASTTSTDGPAYVESVTHTAASLSGTKTFNTDAIKSVTLSASTASSDGPQYIHSISGGSGSLKSYDAATNGNAKTSSGRVPYLHDISHTAASLTGDTTFVKTQGTFNAGTTPVASASPANTSADSSKNSGTAITALTGVKVSSSSLAAPGGHTHTVTVSGTTGNNSGSAVSAVNASYDSGVLTLSTVTAAPDTHTHSYGSPTALTTSENSGTNFSAATAVAADGTANVAPNEHTHTYDKTTGVDLTRGTAPSLDAATSGTVGIDGGSITKTIYYLDHSHNASSGTTRYMKATGTAASTGTVGISGGSIAPVTKYMKATGTAASTGTVGISGGSTSATTKYLHHTHTDASLGTPTTSSVAPNGHTHSYGSSTALTTEKNSGTAVAAVTTISTAQEATNAAEATD